MAGQISIVLKAIDQYSGVITGLNQGFELMGKVIGAVRLGADIALKAVSAAARVVTDLAGSFYQTGQTFEALAIRMNAVFGKGQASDRALEWATEFGAKTPLTLDEVANRLIKLKGAGFDPLDESLGLMQKLGDTSFALGLDFDRLLNPLRKLNSGGKATFESINQLAEAGIPIYDILEQKLGMTADQVQNIAKQNIAGRDIVFKVIDGISERYAGAMEAASNTSAGAMSTIGDIITVFQKRILDAGPWKVFTGYIVDVRDTLDKFLLGDAGNNLARTWGKALETIGHNLSIVFDPRLFAVFLDFAISGFESLYNTIVGNSPFIRLAITEPWMGGIESVKGWGKFVTDSVFAAVRAVGVGMNTALDYLTDTGIVSALEFFAQAVLKTFSFIGGGVVLAMTELAYFVSETLSIIAGDMLLWVQKFPSLADALGIDPNDIADAEVSFRRLGRAAETGGNVVVATLEGMEKSVSGLIGEVAQGTREWRIDLEGVANVHKDINKALDNIDYDPVEDKATDAIRKIYDEAGNLVITGELGTGFPEFKREIGSVTDLLGGAVERAEELDKSLGKKKKVDIEISEKSLRDEIKDVVAGTDWPTEFRGMMELFLTWILAKASGERVPLAITTTG